MPRSAILRAQFPATKSKWVVSPRTMTPRQIRASNFCMRRIFFARVGISKAPGTENFSKLILSSRNFSSQDSLRIFKALPDFSIKRDVMRANFSVNLLKFGA